MEPRVFTAAIARWARPTARDGFDGPETTDELPMQLPHFVPWAADGLVTMSELDPNVAVLYATRFGAVLPQPTI